MRHPVVILVLAGLGGWAAIALAVLGFLVGLIVLALRLHGQGGG